MSDTVVGPASIDPERRISLELEKKVLQHEQGRNGRWFVFYLALGTAFCALAFFLTIRHGYLPLHWGLLVVGLMLFGLAAVTQALAKGQKPVLGFLSVVGIYLLAGMTDRTQRRIDDIDAELSGTLPRYAYEDLSNASAIPFWGLFRAIRNIREARRRGVDLPLSELLWSFDVHLSALSTLAAVGGILFVAYARFLHATTDDVAYGRQCFVRLPRGWMDVTAERRLDPRIDVVVASRYFVATVSVMPFPKAEQAGFDASADAVIAIWRKELGPAFVHNGPMTRDANGQRRREYVLSGPAVGGGTDVHVLTLWETSKFLIVADGCTNHDSYQQCADDFRSIVDNVFALE